MLWLFYFISAIFLAIFAQFGYCKFWLMRISANAIFFQEPKVALGKNPLYHQLMKKGGLEIIFQQALNNGIP